MDDHKIEISFVVVEYLSIEEINTCVEAILRNVSMPCEIIISSNSCYSDEEKHSIPIADARVKWIYNQRNGGFAYAMNQGLKAATGRYMVIMNSDCTISDGMEQMVDFLRQHPDVGAIAPKIIDSQNRIQDTARPYVSVPRFIERHILRILKNNGIVLENGMNYNEVQTVDWLIGAFLMVSRRAYDETQGLDEAYFMYAEDLDWCTRIRQKGMEVVYFPHAHVVYAGTRRARHNRKYASIFLKSHLHYWRKFGFFFGYPKRQHLSL